MGFFSRVFLKLIFVWEAGAWENITGCLLLQEQQKKTVEIINPVTNALHGNMPGITFERYMIKKG